MIARFFLLWLVFTGGVFIWIWIADRVAKAEARRFAWRSAIAAIIALAILGVAFTFNNISGV